MTAAGSRAFVLNYYRRSDGRERRYTIGGFPEWSAAAAREEAKRLKREIDGGADPVGAYQETAQRSDSRRSRRPLRKRLRPTQATIDATGVSAANPHRHPARPRQSEGGSGVAFRH